MKKRDWIEQVLRQSCLENPEGMTAQQVGKISGLNRSTASRYLNELVKLGRARKQAGRPVRYFPADDPGKIQATSRQKPAEDDGLLDDALAALLYPPKGLPILFTGETGVGKTYMAKKLVEVAIEKNYLPPNTPFVSFNCAEYAQNPELLLAQLFGVKKGAYTGAQENRAGLVERANGGILFLDEIHRLPPSGQEMLFYLMDQGFYRRLGEASVEHPARIRLIGATTEPPEQALLPTLQRRFSVQIEIPPLRKRPVQVREQLIEKFLLNESKQMNIPVSLSPECRSRLLTYPCFGNIGQLKSDIQIACARAFLRHMNRSGQEVVIQLHDLPAHLRKQGWISAAIEAKMKDQPAPIEAKAKTTDEAGNIYRELLAAKEQLSKQNISPAELNRQLQETVNEYITRLLHSAKNRQPSGDQETRLFQSIRQVLGQCVDHWNHPLAQKISGTKINALALHIQSYLEQPGPRAKKTFNGLKIEPVYRELAGQIGTALEQALGIRLPKDELDLISLFFSLYQPRSSDPKPRVIATVCLTGEGAAVSLELWLKQHLPEQDQDVLIRAVQIDPLERESGELEELAKSCHLVAVVGTVPPKMKDVPYIPVWELYQPAGWDKLKELLSNSRPGTSSFKRDMKPEPENRLFQLMEQGLRETVTHFNPKKYIDLIQKHRAPFQETFQWTPERELGIWMHLAIYTDQLLKEQINQTVRQNHHTGHKSRPEQPSYLWKNLLLQLESVFSVQYPAMTAQEMTRLSASSV
jgi:transcriptional regulator with AAA-type ATPase domain/transcriptional regulatory protein LevR